MKGILPFYGRLLSPRPLLFSVFLLLFSVSVVKAKTVVVGAGFGYVSVQNMNGLNPGDVLAVAAGQYTGGSFSNLNGITITNNGGTVSFSGTVTLNTLVGCTFSGFQFNNINGIGIRWDGNFRRCIEKNISFNNVSGNANDASDNNLYNGDTSSLKFYICTFDSITVFKSGELMQGSWGDVLDKVCFMDSVIFSNIKIDSTVTSGTEVRGTIFRINAHDLKVTYNGINTVLGDVGIFYMIGNGSIHNIYRTGGRGYIARIWNCGLGSTGNTYFYNNIDLNSTVYGSIDTRVEAGEITQYTTGGNCYIFNNTSGNKQDNISYWSSLAVIGTYPAPFICDVRNNLGFNLQTNGKPFICMDQSNMTWVPDSSNNLYFAKPDGVVDPVTGIPVAGSPVLGKGLTIPWITDDCYHNPRIGAYDIGAVQHGGAIIPATNQPPVAIAGAKQTITLPVNSANLDGTKSYDPDDGIASYLWVLSSGTGGNISTPNASSTAVTGLTQGTYIYKLTVTDNSNATSSAFDTIVVNPAANLPPVANAGPGQTITLPVSTVTLNGNASTDPDGSISAYSWSQITGPSASVITGDSSAIATASSLVAGQYTFQLTVTDNSGAKSSALVKITVAASGAQPPVANAGANQTITLPTNSVTINGSGSLASSGSIVSYAWTEGSGPSTVSLSNTAQEQVNNLQAGKYIFYLTVTDNNGDTGKDSVIITVNPAPNIPPVANAGPDQTITAPASSVDLNGSASSDPDGSISAYSWVKISGPGSITISNSNTATPSVTGLQTGTYIFELTVTDNNGATAKDQVTITVNPKPVQPNQAPIANAGNNLTITSPASSISLNGNSSFDPDGTLSAYSWKQVSGPATAAITGASTATPTVSQLLVGQYVFQLTVTDNDGATANDQVTVTVNPPVSKGNQSPVADAGPDVTIILPVNTDVLDASGSTDPDGTIASYQWQELSGPNTVTSSPMNNAKVTISGLQAGEYAFQVTVMDNDGSSSTATMKITVDQGSAIADQFLIYPNPAHDVANGRITSSINGTIKINMYDMNGRMVMADQVEKASDVVERTFTVSQLASGMYTIQINIANRKTMVAKFIKD